MAKYRKKPREDGVVVEAFQWFGDQRQTDDPEWIVDAIRNTSVWFVNAGKEDECVLVIDTLEGQMEAKPGDWIIRCVDGELYPCTLDVFEKTYEQVDDEEGGE